MRRTLAILGALALAAAAGCGDLPAPATRSDPRARAALLGRWQSEARTMRLGAQAPRLNGADGRVVGQELVFLQDGQLVIESQLDGAVDLDVATATYEVVTQNLLVVVRYPRKPMPGPPGTMQEEIRYTFYFDRGALVLNRDEEKLIFKKVGGPDTAPPRAEPAAAVPTPAGVTR
jgi:hypothetical protein